MPIRQPLETTIHLNDFQNHTFSFPVESVLVPQQGSGKLVISASAGYLLTTSSDREPTPEQTLDHILQPDGNRVARGTVTLLANEEPAEDSTITIRNPSGETVILTVDSSPEAASAGREPVLTLSTNELVFAKTPVGKPAFLVLKVKQQNADTPVTITTDVPESFQLASDSRPAFGPDLTFIPSATGTYIHVRHTPVRSGKAEGYLFVKSPYADQLVTLTGKSTRLLPAVVPAQAARPPQPTQAARPVSMVRGLLLTTVLVAGLAALGYTFRCQLMPSLCESVFNPAATRPTPAPAAPVAEEPATERVTTNATARPPAAREAAARPDEGNTDAGDEIGDVPSGENATPVRKRTRVVAEEPDSKPAPNPNRIDESVSPPATVPASVPANRRSQPKQPEATQSKRSEETRPGEKQSEPVSPTTAESELERELNTKKPKNQ